MENLYSILFNVLIACRERHTRGTCVKVARLFRRSAIGDVDFRISDALFPECSKSELDSVGAVSSPLLPREKSIKSGRMKNVF